eukprot:Selendium_serpulae@DN5219_c0_g1_i1.p1
MSWASRAPAAGKGPSLYFKGEKQESEKFVPHYDPTKFVGRLWATRPDDDEDEEDEAWEEEAEDEEDAEHPIVADTSLQDSRLEKLRQLCDSDSESELPPEQRSKRRHEEAVVESINAFELGKNRQANQVDGVAAPDLEAEEDLESRRERLREAAILKRKQEEADLRFQLQSDSEDSEHDSDSDDGLGGRIKPKFVPVAERATVKEQELLQKEMQKREIELKRKAEERRVETQQLLIEAIRSEEAADVAAENARIIDDSDTEMPPETDGADNDEEEYEMWKIRELNRIKRDKEERISREKFLAEIERRRNMTEEERRESNRALDEANPKKDKKSKYTFMQKYYHQGAYFQHLEDPLYNRDYNKPTAEDTVDKKAVPRPMKLRRGEFGKAGQTKHTHLADIDTTDMSSAWSQLDTIRVGLQSKMAGIKGANDFGGPRKRKEPPAI